jgi:membrane AbrB-like protein
VSAGIHVSGVSEFVAPREIVNGAQVVLGTVVGCRFVGTPTREILRILALSLGSTFILLSLTGLFGFALGQVSPYGMLPVVLAYSPGGLAEMSLVALAIHADVAFVATHHIARVLIVMLGAAPVFALVERRRRKARAACRKPHE